MYQFVSWELMPVDYYTNKSSMLEITMKLDRLKQEIKFITFYKFYVTDYNIGAGSKCKYTIIPVFEENGVVKYGIPMETDYIENYFEGFFLYNRAKAQFF